MTDKMLFFAKFGPQNFMELLLKEGIIFMNTVHEFKKIDDNFRGDKNEGVGQVIQAEHAKVEMEFMGQKFRLDKDTGLVDQILISPNSYVNTNIYSLYMIKAEDHFKVNKLVYQFGEYVVLLKDSLEFLKRIFKAIDDVGLSAKSQKIEYIDRKVFQGELSIFNKFSEYEYQNEYRIHVVNKEDKPLILKIGSIEDIAIMFPSQYLDHATIKIVQKNT